MVRNDPLDPTGALAELARMVQSDKATDDILHDVVRLAERRVHGTEDASITLIRGKKAGTVAASGPIAVALDELQYAEGVGPCLEAGRADEIRHITDAATESRWPRYIEKARPLGLRSSLSLPLPVEGNLVGALNLYATTADAFDQDAIALGVAFADHATIALSHAQTTDSHRRRAGNLAHALESRAVIEQAKGMIMAQRKCDAETAFGMLRDLSMSQNVKLYELAAQLVSSASNHPVPDLAHPPGFGREPAG
jgi:GAF domain-containing protein